jgi:hypothetical protein
MSEWDSEFGWEVEFRHEERRAQRAKLLTPPQPAQEPVAISDGAIWDVALQKCGQLHGDVLHLNREQIASVVRAFCGQAQPAQEPVAFYNPQHGGFYWAKPTTISAPQAVDIVPLALYAYPQQRPWVGLTEEEVEHIADSEWEEAFVRLIEAKLKEKNT